MTLTEKINSVKSGNLAFLEKLLEEIYSSSEDMREVLEDLTKHFVKMQNYYQTENNFPKFVQMGTIILRCNTLKNILKNRK